MKLLNLYRRDLGRRGRRRRTIGRLKQDEVVRRRLDTTLVEADAVTGRQLRFEILQPAVDLQRDATRRDFQSFSLSLAIELAILLQQALPARRERPRE